MGSVYFFYLLAVFSMLTNLTMVVISVLTEEVFQFRSFQLMQECALGFSGRLVQRPFYRLHTNTTCFV